MNKTDYYLNNSEKNPQTQSTPSQRITDIQQDFSEDEFFDNINSTPLGRLLKLIATMPEIRHQKVTEVRTQISDGQYDINHNLDEALDRVLEELIAEG
jgi:anti-sigma28 factor (negative regulator of flagellin synthesis)